MALFALWRDDAVSAPADRLHRRLAAEAHIVPEATVSQAIDTPGGRWQIAAFACATHFYSAEAQVWHEPGEGACLLHGVAWREVASQARLIDAAGFAALLDHAGARPDAAIHGEYAVARLLPDGSLLAFTDRTGVHQLFHRPDRPHMVASRAAFLALLSDDWTPDAEAGLWLATIGYRVGQASGWRGVRQLGQSEMITGGAIERLPARALCSNGERGLAEPLLEQGIAEAQMAIRLAAGDGQVELPVTGGKDSRAVLALCLGAGLGERLTLTTRGLPDHPDVVAAQRIAQAVGRPHRLVPPRTDPAGTDEIESLVTALQTHGYQTDGGMGGWDLLVGGEPGTATMLTGHLGEVLKGVVKQPLVGADPIAIVAAQAPFDPMGLLRPEARAGLENVLATHFNDMLTSGIEPDDLANRLYYHNRVPNWLGGIRGVRAHEAQPIMPLGAPALLDLAFRLTPAERARDLIPFRIVRDCAPQLLALPFAHQRWSWPDAPQVAPVLAPAELPLFGNWQWRINRSPALRRWLRDLFRTLDIPLWEGIDRAALIDRLETRRFDYRDGIALLGIVAAAFHQAGFVRTRKTGDAPEQAGSGRPRHALPEMAAVPVEIAGYVDAVSGAARRDGESIVLMSRHGQIEIGGWAWSPSVPGASVTMAARADDCEVASAEASGARPDLQAAGIGGGGYGFSLRFDAALLMGAARLTIAHGAAAIASFALVDESVNA